MKELLVWLTTWRRPDLLARTLPTLRESLAGVDCDIQLTVNEADPQTLAVAASHPWITTVDASPDNRGLLPPVVAARPRFAGYRYVLFVEDDALHHEPKRTYLDLFAALPFLGAVTGYYEARHGQCGQLQFGGRAWKLAPQASAVDLLVRSETLLALGPPPGPESPVHKFCLDVWIVQLATHCLQHRRRPVAVCEGGVTDIGRGRSTWQGASAHEEFRGQFA